MCDRNDIEYRELQVRGHAASDVDFFIHAGLVDLRLDSSMTMRVRRSSASDSLFCLSSVARASAACSSAICTSLARSSACSESACVGLGLGLGHEVSVSATTRCESHVSHNGPRPSWECCSTAAH
eukprot:TRINITY_DN2450_c0_g1_i3.p2 TRINITY_DN2450_c0_g1~~TRINITY_DN2450_c0_g1_i3.p2  ORF type:complete len:125 (-),score=6.09 TRINITY_DN2450_c0_g1_i3:1519-1893(-)